jgi:hypothetical protein
MDLARSEEQAMSEDGYTYARFWKCALQVNTAGYLEAYRWTGHGLDETSCTCCCSTTATLW